MSNVAADTDIPTDKLPWQVPAGSVAGLLLLGNTWTQNAYFEFLVGGMWERGVGYNAALVGGLLVGFAMMAMSLFAAVWLSETKALREKHFLVVLGSGLIVFFVASAFSWMAMLARGNDIENGSAAIQRLKTAEVNNGGRVTARAELQRATASYETLKNSQDLVISYRDATVKPEKLIGILAAANALPAGHPATVFVIENNLARPQDVRAIQIALLNQARGGDAASRNALALLGGSGSKGDLL